MVGKTNILEKSRELTAAIFNNVETAELQYRNYEIVWAIYDQIHILFSIPYCLKIKKSSSNKKSTGNLSPSLSVALSGSVR